MLLPIAQLGQPVLRTVAEPVAAQDIGHTAFQSFLSELTETLIDSKGVGLAAPQVFVPLRVFVAYVEDPRDDGQTAPIVFINPTIVKFSDQKVAEWEGCLSFPELSVLVPRFQSVEVDFIDTRGERKALALDGFFARVVQHEYDHLEGILTLDRAMSTRDIIKKSEIDAIRKNIAPEGLNT